VFDRRRPGAPCYHCLFPEGQDLEETRCAVMGVFAPITGIIGTIQAAEALKLLADVGESLNGRLLLLDGLSMEWRQVRLPRDAACAVCGNNT
jgi:adenylyltransferase/sulfurtransferase